MTADMINKKARQLINKRPTIMIEGAWALKNSPKEGRKCLERLSGRIGSACAWLPPKDWHEEEYKNALRIIKEYERLKNG